MSRYNKHTVLFLTSFMLLFTAYSGSARSFGEIMGKEPRYLWTDLVVSLGNCNAPTVVDLYSIWGVGVSPSQGYWGRSDGTPVDNIIRTSDYINEGVTMEGVVDTFYFYPTVADYCGLKQGDYMAMIVNFTGECTSEDDPSREIFEFVFCGGSPMEMRFNVEIIPMTIENLIASTIVSTEEREFLLNGDGSWKKTVQCYSDSSLTNLLASDSEELANLISPDVEGKRKFYIRFADKVTGLTTEPKSLTVLVHPKPQLIINIDPDINDRFREYDIDDEISITIQNSDVFDTINYYLNTKYLNKYFLGGETGGKAGAGTVKLSAMLFTGAEDIIRIDALDSNKCFVDTTLIVVVNVPLPNVFTPDGDGVNDVFFGGDKFADREIYLEIFNRWGNRLYSGNEGWNGTYNGAEVPPGTYYYALHLKSPDGSTKIYKGSVTLVRNRR